MEPSVLIAALALAVDLFRAVFDVAWEIHNIKRKNRTKKKSDCRRFQTAQSLSF